MEERSLKYLVEACRGELIGKPPGETICGVSTDTRTIRNGEVFVALAGEKFDGHDFITAAVEKGATAVIVERSRLEKLGDIAGLMEKVGIIVVENTKTALGNIARKYREDFNLPVIAVCGSNGKSTTKELIASVLAQRFKVHKSPASFNNDIGVPLTLLGISSQHDVAVIEAGTNHRGELKPLIDMIRPRYGVITSIGREHLGYFNSIEAVAEEEGTVAQELPDDGRLFFNLENIDPGIANSVLLRSRAPVITVGLGGTSNWRANVLKTDLNGTKFSIQSPAGEYSGEYEINIPGQHQVTNALLAMAIGAEFGLSKEEIRDGLKNAVPPDMRMQKQLWKGVWIINDAYNANPDSMSAGLKTLSQMSCAGKKIAVLGTMAELGIHSEFAHREIGETAGRLGIDCLIAVGEYSQLMAESALKAGVRRVEVCKDPISAAERLKSICAEGDLVLIKASRCARLEKVVEYLTA